MLTDYSRARLRKIESLSFRVLAEDDRRQEHGMEPLLSLEERDFAIEYTFRLFRLSFRVPMLQIRRTPQGALRRCAR